MIFKIINNYKKFIKYIFIIKMLIRHKYNIYKIFLSNEIEHQLNILVLVIILGFHIYIYMFKLLYYI